MSTAAAFQKNKTEQEEQKAKLSLEEVKTQEKAGNEADDGVGFSIFKDMSKLTKTKVEKIHKDAITSVNLIYDEE